MVWKRRTMPFYSTLYRKYNNWSLIEALKPISYTFNYSVITGSYSIVLGQIKLVLRKNTTEISQSCELFSQKIKRFLMLRSVWKTVVWLRYYRLFLLAMDVLVENFPFWLSVRKKVLLWNIFDWLCENSCDYETVWIRRALLLPEHESQIMEPHYLGISS